MARGESWTRAKVTINDVEFSNVRAIVFQNDARLTDRRSNEIVATMTGPITVSDVTQKGATWTNGSETWYIQKQGCSCRGEA